MTFLEFYFISFYKVPVTSSDKSYSELVTFTLTGHVYTTIYPVHRDLLFVVMSLSFPFGSQALANWGFGAGDIAVLAGAGRAVITWVMAPSKDRSLLEFLQLDTQDIFLRRGIIDPAALHSRWDRQLTLFRNGKKLSITGPGRKPVVENLSPFTWFMTLTVAALEGAVYLKTLHKIILEFAMEIFKDKTSGLEFVQKEMVNHTQGWQSIACVRNISLVGRTAWERLAREGKHPPGQIPESDCGEIVRLLMWIAAGKDREFLTSSTDTFSIAIILSEIGLSLLRVRTSTSDQDFDENQMVVSLSTSYVLGHKGNQSSVSRYGMRVPLDYMHEAVSLWPGDEGENNLRRMIFQNGMRAAKGIEFRVYSETNYFVGDTEPSYEIAGKAISSRVESTIFPLVNSFFLVHTLDAIKGLETLVATWKTPYLETLVADLTDAIDLRPRDQLYLDQLQVFLLGYYYAALRPILNTSELSYQEAFGTWSWRDVGFLRIIRDFCKKHSYSSSGECRTWLRYEVMRIMAYFFCGASHDQLRSPKFAPGIVGVIGKLSLVTASLIGQGEDPEKVGQFWLLDLDPTCIPSDFQGMVLCGKPSIYETIDPLCEAPSNLQSIDPSNENLDFTSHIEPDWNNDAQQCVIAFRHKGRIIHRTTPLFCDNGVLRWWTRLMPMALERGPPDLKTTLSVIHVKLEEFYGDKIVYPRHLLLHNDEVNLASMATRGPPIAISAWKLPKARACMLGLYFSQPSAEEREKEQNKENNPKAKISLGGVHARPSPIPINKLPLVIVNDILIT